MPLLEVGIRYPTRFIFEVAENFRSSIRIELYEAVDVGTTTSLKLVVELIVGNAELRLKDSVKERSKSFIEVLGSNVRTRLEIPAINKVPI